MSATEVAQANAAFQAKQWPQAVALFRQLQAADPDNAEYRYALAASLFNLGADRLLSDAAEAIALFNEACELSGDAAMQQQANQLINEAQLLLHNRATRAINEQRFEEARRDFEQCLVINPENEGARQLLAQCWFVQGARLYPDQPDAAHRCNTKALKLDPFHHGAARNALITAGELREPARLEDYTDRDPDSVGRHLVLACAQKCGSSFTLEALLELSGYWNSLEPYATQGTPYEIHPLYMERIAAKNSLSQRHIPASRATINLFQAYGVQTVVLYRNLFDCIVSMTDFLASGIARWWTYMPDLSDWPRERQLEATIDLYAREALEIYASWRRAEAEGSLKLHFASYESMLEDKVGHIRSICEFAQIEASQARIEQVVSELDGSPEKTKFNKGVQGRGAELSEAQQERIRELASRYTGVDFAPLGL